MKINSLLLLFMFAIACSSSHHVVEKKEKQLFQYGVIDGLLAGAFDGDLSINKLKKYGDFGIGTFNRADGELIALEGEVYRVNEKGTVLEIENDSTPFVSMVKYQPDTSFIIQATDGYMQLQEIILQKINPNSIYAVKLRGHFDSLTTRAVAPAQKPYPTLTELVNSSQHLFQYQNLDGNCIGFFIPDYMGRINVPGFHFHFLSSDHLKGGHVFALSGRDIQVFVQELHSVLLLSNRNESFMQAANRKDRSDELKKIE